MRARRWFKWTATCIVGAALAFAIIGITVEYHKLRGFQGLETPARQLAIFDAACDHITTHYYDREFIAGGWPALRAEWRARAANVKSDAELYDQVFVPMVQKLPSSHVWALAPQSLIDALRAEAPDGDAPTWSGFDHARLFRGRATRGVVADVMPGTPAAQAGLLPGSQIESLSFRDGRVQGEFFVPETAQHKHAYEAAENVTVSIPFPPDMAAGEMQRFGEDYLAARRVKLEFAQAPGTPPASFETRTLAGGVSYIRFDEFQQPIMDQVLAALVAARPAGVILDLRRNGGGRVAEEQRLMNRLLDEGAVFGIEKTAQAESVWRSAADPMKYRGPLRVLIGPVTASAGEVAAAALQDNRRARLSGRMTSGATITSANFPLPDGGRIQIGMGDFVRVNGARIEGVGVTPDVIIFPELADIRSGRDVVLERALAELATDTRADDRATR